MSKKSSAPSSRSEKVQPYIPASKNLPEITIKAFLLGAILTIIMAASNAYLGLKIGQTIAATIPAAVISMTLLRFFRHSNILENNIVQTTVSTGEGLAGATVFTIPALVMMQYWTDFPFWIIACVLTIGGILGVLFSIPLRRALIVESGLKFPEGIAAAEVLKVGDSASREGAKSLLYGGLLSAILKFGQSGFPVFGEAIHYFKKVGQTVFGVGTGLPAILIGAGYIVGLEVGLTLVVGYVCAWLIGIPIIAYQQGIPADVTAYDCAIQIWSKYIRMMGVGIMVVGGIWMVLSLLKPVKIAIVEAFKALRHSNGRNLETHRTERDIPILYVGIGLILMAVVLTGLVHYLFMDKGIPHDHLYPVLIGVVTLMTLVLAFLASVIIAYIAGSIGSSVAPVSGVIIMGILFISLAILAFIMPHLGVTVSALSMSAITVLLGAIIGSSAIISCDNMQDLKAGQIVGATPWKQQVMLIIGTVITALIMAPVLNVLLKAYGIGDILPNPNMDPTQAMAAPKAALMAALSQGVFDRSLDWTLIGTGVGIGIGAILLSEYLKWKKASWNFSVLTFALAFYLPLDIIFPVFFGGLIAHLAEKKLRKGGSKMTPEAHKKAMSHADHRGLLVASGIVAGEAIIGIVIAGGIVSWPAFADMTHGQYLGETAKIILGVGLFSFIGYYLYRAGSTLKASK